MARPLPPPLKALLKELSGCMTVDRFRLRRKLHQLADKADDAGLERLKNDITASQTRLLRRKNTRPTLEYPPQLPVSERREDILAAIQQHPIILICGETGSGKTTQLPKICLEAGRGISGMIGHTQPRRLAASAVSSRIAEEMHTVVGEEVGYKVRFHDKVSPRTLIKVMTDGILLAEMQRDRWLNQYDTLIIDEAHERSLNIDFLLGYLKQLLKKRPDLKLIITSATIDAERIARHFDNAPIIEVSGRTFPVETLYRPLQNAEDEGDSKNLVEAIDEAIDELHRHARGDILVFLPGEREIRELSHALRHRRDRMEILPLYARLPASEQKKIFHPTGQLRVILTTNVAETSLTVPGIRYVIDTGTARISRYSWRSKVQRLPVEKVSQASANRRLGRCGRLSSGICIRLYVEDDFNNRPEFTDPEILRTNLASVILQMSMLKLGSPNGFPFIDMPDPRLVKDGYRLLEELQAVNTQHSLTPLGQQLGKLPIDPRLGRMLLAAQKTGATHEVLTIITALAVQDPRERPYEKRQAADEQHARFKHPKSDFISILLLWEYLEHRHEELSQNKFRTLCGKEFISYRRWREWRDVHRQVKLACNELKIRFSDKSATEDNIHQALLTGLLDHIGQKEEKQEFLGCRGRKFLLFPGSNLGKKPPKWVMAAEVTETTKLYARTAAQIQPQWVEHLGAHLLKHHYSEPHWVQSKARVGAYDRLSLYGLVIVAKQPINYASIDPVLSREIFIRHALVFGEYTSSHAVLKQNRHFIEGIEDLEARTRRRDILIDEQDLYAFYDRIIPDHITSGTAFEAWFKKLPHKNLLKLDPEQLTRDDAPSVNPHAFPDTWVHKGLSLPLHYLFEPGSEKDGVTLTVPLSILKQIDAARIQWLVPGLIKEKILAMIRSLPKAQRKNFVPAPDFAHAAEEALNFGKGRLDQELSLVLEKMTGLNIPSEAWAKAFEPHLMMRFNIIDSQRKPLASGRDIESLIKTLGSKKIEPTPTPKVQQRFKRGDITQWDFGVLPANIQCEEAGYSLQRFPALKEENKQLVLDLFDTQKDADRAHLIGTRRLLAIHLKQEARYLDKNLPGMSEHCLRYTSIGTCQQLKHDLLLAAIQQSSLDESALPRNQETFEKILCTARADLVERATRINTLLSPILQHLHTVHKKLKGNLPLSWIEAASDIKTQLDQLVYKGFLLATPADKLTEMPRYLEAMVKRLDKLTQAPDRDRMHRVSVEPLQQRFLDLSDERKEHPQAQLFRWALEELRVSLFAQELGTQEKVSVKRLEAIWKKTE